MDYLAMLAQKPPFKAALITEQRIYTYGDLCKLAQQRRNEISGSRRAFFIKKTTVAEQLIEFIALAGTDWVPVLARCV